MRFPGTRCEAQSSRGGQPRMDTASEQKYSSLPGQARWVPPAPSTSLHQCSMGCPRKSICHCNSSEGKICFMTETWALSEGHSISYVSFETKAKFPFVMIAGRNINNLRYADDITLMAGLDELHLESRLLGEMSTISDIWRIPLLCRKQREKKTPLDEHECGKWKRLKSKQNKTNK